MSLISEKFKSKKCASSNISQDCSLLTGIDIIDLANGSYDPVRKKFEVGPRPGRMIGVVGFTGSGKSTLINQMVSAITIPFENGSIHVIDSEKAYKYSRMRDLFTMGNPDLISKFEEQFPMENLLNADTYLDDALGLLNDLYAFKMENAEALMEDYEDVNGDVHKMMPPSVITIDSLAALYSRSASANIESGEEDSNMNGGRTAKENNAFFSKTLNQCFKANIILAVCNHITTNISTNRFAPVQAKVPWLKPEENIKGGTGFSFLCDFFVRIHPGSKLSPDKDYKIRGRLNTLEVLKSRGNSSGRSYPLVFDMDTARYNNILSDVQFLYENGAIESGGKVSRLGGFTFTKGTVLEKCKKDPALEQAIREATYDVFKKQRSEDYESGSDALPQIPEGVE